MENVNFASLGYAPASPTKIRPGWKGQPVTNSLDYYEYLSITVVIFITLGLGHMIAVAFRGFITKMAMLFAALVNKGKKLV